MKPFCDSKQTGWLSQAGATEGQKMVWLNWMIRGVICVLQGGGTVANMDEGSCLRDLPLKS